MNKILIGSIAAATAVAAGVGITLGVKKYRAGRPVVKAGATTAAPEETAEQTEKAAHYQTVVNFWMDQLMEADTIEFKEEYANGTGYFDGLTTANLPYRSHFTDPHGRRVLVIPYDRGENLVIFERYTPDGEAPQLIIQVPNKTDAELHGLRTGSVYREIELVMKVLQSLDLIKSE